MLPSTLTLYTGRAGVSGAGGLLAGDPGLRRQAVRTHNSCQGNLSHVTAEDGLLEAWPPYKAFRGKKVLKSGLAESETPEDWN